MAKDDLRMDARRDDSPSTCLSSRRITLHNDSSRMGCGALVEGCNRKFTVTIFASLRAPHHLGPRRGARLGRLASRAGLAISSMRRALVAACASTCSPGSAWEAQDSTYLNGTECRLFTPRTRSASRGRLGALFTSTVSKSKTLLPQTQLRRQHQKHLRSIVFN